MFNEDEYSGTKNKVRTKIICLVENLLEGRKAASSDAGSDVAAHEKPYEFFGFLFKSTKTRTRSDFRIRLDHLKRSCLIRRKTDWSESKKKQN